jgi:hypothetical protein
MGALMHGKDDGLAESWKEKGRQLFTTGNYTEAMNCYNEVICCAHTHSHLLGVAYANKVVPFPKTLSLQTFSHLRGCAGVKRKKLAMQSKILTSLCNSTTRCKTATSCTLGEENSSYF